MHVLTRMLRALVPRLAKRIKSSHDKSTVSASVCAISQHLGSVCKYVPGTRVHSRKMMELQLANCQCEAREERSLRPLQAERVWQSGVLGTERPAGVLRFGPA